MRLCWGRWKRPEGAPLRSPPFAHLAAGPHLGRGIGGGREGPGGTGGSENIGSSGRGSGGANSGATAAAESTPLLGTQSEELRGGVCWRGRLRDTLVYPGTAQSVPKVLLATPFPPPEDSQNPHRHPGPPQPLPELHTWPEAARTPGTTRTRGHRYAAPCWTRGGIARPAGRRYSVPLCACVRPSGGPRAAELGGLAAQSGNCTGTPLPGFSANLSLL